MKILFLSQWFPYPANNGSKLRIYNLLYGLAQHHEVTLLSFTDQPQSSLNLSGLQPICKKVHAIAWKPFNRKSKRSLMGFINLAPRSVVDTFSIEMEHRIDEEISTTPYDVVIASQINMAGYAKSFHGLPALLEEIELSVLYEQYTHASSLLSRFRHGLTWFKFKHYLNTLLRYFNLCTVVSEKEKCLFTRTISNRKFVEIIPNCVNLSYYSGILQSPQPNELVFTGSFSYTANYDAMCWFVSEIFDKIKSIQPRVHITITGDCAGLSLPNVDNITLTGLVEDVRPIIASSWISLAPIREGGGTRLKILEAMALRTPVVATSKGAEGLDVQNNVHLLIADSPDDFANAVIRIMNEPGLRDRLVDNAYRLVQQKYDWSSIMPMFLNIVEKISYMKGT